MNQAYEKGREANEFAKACREKYINENIKSVSETDLRNALRKVNQKNKELRESFRITNDVLNFRCY
jgi:hypothetical protein